jgi:hypothetical protein
MVARAGRRDCETFCYRPQRTFEETLRQLLVMAGEHTATPTC